MFNNCDYYLYLHRNKYALKVPALSRFKAAQLQEAGTVFKITTCLNWQPNKKD